MRRAALAMAIALAAGPAAAAPRDEVHACVTASERGQRLREKLQFKEAREEFVACSRDVCPAVVRSECVKWTNDIVDRMPSIIIRAKDEAGNDVTDVRMFVDDQLAQDRLDGRRLDIDPGPHTLRFERAGNAPREMKVLVREAERNRFVDIVLGEAPKPKPDRNERPPAPEDGKPFPIAAALLGGVAVLGGVTFAILASSGNSDVSHLRSTCAPKCSSSDVSSAKTKIILANVALGVGILALAGAGYYLFVAPSGASSSAGATVGLRF